jgi:hypothetical protein
MYIIESNIKSFLFLKMNNLNSQIISTASTASGSSITITRTKVKQIELNNDENIKPLLPVKTNDINEAFSPNIVSKKREPV